MPSFDSLQPINEPEDSPRGYSSSRSPVQGLQVLVRPLCRPIPFSPGSMASVFSQDKRRHFTADSEAMDTDGRTDGYQAGVGITQRPSQVQAARPVRSRDLGVLTGGRLMMVFRV